jgi:hypothetical protein
MDIKALVEIISAHSTKRFEARRAGKPYEDDKASIEAQLNALPDKPDDKLR